MERWFLVIIALSFTAMSVNCVMFKLEPNGQKCLKEELQSQVPVTGEIEVTYVPEHIVDYIVRDSRGHILAQKQDVVKAKFSFVTETYDTYEICFTSHVPGNYRSLTQEVKLITKEDSETKNYDGMLEAAKYKPIELELKKLEDLSEDIVKDFAFMRQQQEKMSDTNESTNTKLFYFTLFSMSCVLSLASWQLWYLRNYFKAKKLIE